MPSLMDALREKIAKEPNPPRPKTQGQAPDSAVRRNRVRIGLPELPTEKEQARWEAKRRER